MTALGIAAVVLVAIWSLSTGGPEPPSVNPISHSVGQLSPETPSEASVRSSATEGAAHNTTPKAAERDDLSRWIKGLDIIDGALSASEVATATSYVEPMMMQAVRELRATTVDAQDPIGLAKEAKIVKRLELWKAVSRALVDGEYLILTKSPSSWKAPPKIVVQTLQTWRNGESVTLLFTLDSSEYPTLGDAVAYEKEIHRFRLREAARKFNMLSDTKREALYREFRQRRKENGAWAALPAKIRATFPIENWVNERSFLMFVPQ